jgi:hydrogenase maturation factor
MSRAREEILRKLKEISRNNQFINVPGKVVSVDETKKTCKVNIDELEYEDIRLNAVVDDNNDTHSYVVPKVGSWVMVSFIENSETDGFLSSFSEIDKLILNANEIVFNKGELKGLAKVEALKSKLNALENAFNTFLSHYKAHNHVHPSGPTTAFVIPSTQSNLQQTQLSDIENTKIKQ